MHRSYERKSQSKTPVQGKKRKVLISFISPDQDDWEFKKSDESFLKTFEKKPKDRYEIWRPSVALAQLKGLSFDEYYLLWGGDGKHHAELVKKIAEDIQKVIKDLGRDTQLTVSDLKISKPFETSDVYPKLFKYLSQPEFQRSDTEYYVNCTNGTTQMRNCLFLLTHTGHVKAYRIAPTPWADYRKRDRRCVEGSYAIEDPNDFGKAYEDIDKKKTSNKVLDKLGEGPLTKDQPKLKSIARDIKEIMSIKDVEFRNKQVILITGETGVGKTQLAQNIAAAFGFKEKNFIALNCATLRGADPNLPRIELFGCTKGAASGLEEKTGAFKDADGGILFLDEIGELSLEMQAMLLTALDKGMFIPLGGTAASPVHSNFQLICGTNRSLEKAVQASEFRRDLFNRINTWHFELPPLREQRQDITNNLKEQVSRIGKQCGKDNFEIQKDAEDLFRDFAENDTQVTWDGNFRELNAMITRMVVRSKGERIEKEIVEEEIAEARKRYGNKESRGNGTTPPDIPTGKSAGDQVEATSHAEAARSLVGADAYNKLSLVEKAELELLVKTITEDHSLSQLALCQKVYGDKLTPSGLSRRLKSQFQLRFAHRQLERLQGQDR